MVATLIFLCEGLRGYIYINGFLGQQVSCIKSRA